MTEPGSRPSTSALSKVPQVTVFFWVIKVLCTTVGETASDFLDTNVGLGLTGTAVAAGVCLAIVLVVQLGLKRYTPPVYWLAVVLISVFGTLITDILTDSLKFPLEASTILFSVALGLTFAAWYASEKTLSIHSIFTRKREAFYWLAILFTFALGTATGDLVAEKLGVGYLGTGILVVGIIAATAVAWRLGMDPVLSFWIAYILTRPLGASLGDYLSQARADGGLGLGATVTSAVFLVAILAVVIYLAVTRKDQNAEPEAPAQPRRPGVVRQVVAVVTVLVALGIAGYYLRNAQLQRQATSASTATRPLGNLSAFRTLATELTSAVHAGDWTAAKAKADDLEHDWDSAQAKLQRMNPAKWTQMDDAIDAVLKHVRASQDAAATASSVEAFRRVIETLDPS